MTPADSESTDRLIARPGALSGHLGDDPRRRPTRRGGEPTRTFRSIWVSDTHLGTRGCKAEALQRFLRDHKAENLYLVGDIIDGWSLRKNWYWDEAHNRVLRRILWAATHDTQVHLVAGNHDEFLRDWLGHDFGGVKIVDEVVHETADGKRLLVLHGDRFDVVTRNMKWLALLGDWAYQATLVLNDWFNAARRRLGRPYWSLSQFLKQRVKSAVSYIDSFERALAREAKERGFDGVVCGHIHKAEIREVDGVLYINDGDWVESCTAVVEHFDGRLEILEFPVGHDVARRPPRGDRTARPSAPTLPLTPPPAHSRRPQPVGA